MSGGYAWTNRLDRNLAGLSKLGQNQTKFDTAAYHSVWTSRQTIQIDAFIPIKSCLDDLMTHNRVIMLGRRRTFHAIVMSKHASPMLTQSMFWREHTSNSVFPFGAGLCYFPFCSQKCLIDDSRESGSTSRTDRSLSHFVHHKPIATKLLDPDDC